MFVAVSLIVLVAALALVADLALIISSKRPEIGMLGAMGATPATLRRAFLLLGGAGRRARRRSAAALSGSAAAWVLDRYRLLRLPGGSTSSTTCRSWCSRWTWWRSSSSPLVLALACSFYAAQRAAALDPVEAMRR